MAAPPASRLRLPRQLFAEVVTLSKSATAPFRLVQRAKLVVLACQGLSNAEIARRVGVTAQTVRKWRRRIERDGKLLALSDAHRSGRPAEVPAEVRAEVIKLACNRPDKVRFQNTWTLRSLRRAVKAVTGWDLSTSEIRRILNCEGVRPHHVRVWLHSPDPDFASKVSRICSLYLETPPHATLVCVDEKPGIQALRRIHPTRHLANGVRYEFEYKRHGTSTLIAALNVRTGEVFGRCQRRDAAGLVRFMEELARKYPTGPVYVVWDNLNIHYDGPDKRWTRFNERHGGRFHFVHTPLHASWVNQVEIWFSILQRRVIKHGSFASVKELERAVLGFIAHWNRVEAHPFNWTFRGIRKSVLAQAA